MPKQIGVFTGNRAEYGLLAPLLTALTQSDLQPVLWVAQDHWLTGTVAEIKADGYPIGLALKPDTATAALTQPGQRMTLLAAELMAQLGQSAPNVDALVILGDRFEAAACALTAKLLGIPIIHLGGGDITQGGCVDDDLRDMISSLATYHCPFTEQSAQRLRQMGCSHVYRTSSLVYDNVHQLPLIPKQPLFESLGLDANKPLALFTQHPIPAEGNATVAYFNDSLQALKTLKETLGLQTVATYPNMDGYADGLKTLIDQHTWATWVPSLGRLRYLSLMKVCQVVVGNTSSGLIETPFFNVPSVTIGPRQHGRELGSNVIACEYGQQAVAKAVKQALTSSQTQSMVKHPFGDQPAAPQIMAVIRRALQS